MYRLTITILSILLVAVTTFDIFICTNNNFSQQPNVHNYKYIEYNEYYLTQQEAVDLCTDLVGDYKIVFNNEQAYLGCAVIIFGVCYINKHQSGWRMLEVLTHELIHLHYWTRSETFTQFMTFKLLYESENVVLHNKGIEIAVKQLGGAYSGVYDCSWYINEYLGDDD